MQEHFQDEYVKLAQAQGYRSRAVFKLNEIQEKDQIIKPGMNIIDFTGKPVNPRTLFGRYKLFVTPSVLIVDGTGQELAERQIGINTVDYYGYYLDQAIDQALQAIRGRAS